MTDVANQPQQSPPDTTYDASIEAAIEGPKSTLFETTISVSIEDAWTLLRDFGHWNKWLTIVEKMEILNDKTGVGLLRKNTIAASKNTYTTQLVALDDEKHSLRYQSITSEPAIPGLIWGIVGVDCESVSPLHTKITWSLWTSFDETKITEEIKEKIFGIMRASWKEDIELLEKYIHEHPTGPKSTFAEATIDVSIEDAWALLRDYGHWEKWITTIEKMEILNDKTGVGLMRRYLMGETKNCYISYLTALDDDNHSLRYQSGPIEPPIPGFISATMGVDCEKISPSQTKITWSLWSTFDNTKIPEEATQKRFELTRLSWRNDIELLEKYIHEQKQKEQIKDI